MTEHWSLGQKQKTSILECTLNKQQFHSDSDLQAHKSKKETFENIFEMKKLKS